MHNLYKRAGVWYVRYWTGGKDVRRSLRTGNRTEALRRAKPYLTKANQIRAGEERHEYTAAVLKWTQEVLPDLRAGTKKRYLVSARQLYSHFKPYYVDQINRRIIADYVSARKKAKVTNATIRRDLTALSRILSCAANWGWIDRNPVRDLERGAIASERREPIVLPAGADIDRLVRGGDSFSRLVRFLQYTGMRQQEAVNLEWRDIEGQYARLTRTKTGRPRMVHLDERALGTLSGAVERMGCPYVFWIINPRTGDPGPYRNFASNFTNRVRRLHARGAISRRFRCHDLRHWYAVDYLQNGGDIYDLSQQLGHSSVKVTEIYLGYVGREAEPARGKERA